MNPHHNQNYTKTFIEEVLFAIRQCVSSDKYSISLNEKRPENISFIREYNLRSDKIKAILTQIRAEVFCHSLRNTKPGYEHEVLYVFVPQVTLFNALDEEETVDIYTKFNVTGLPSAIHTIVISFHKRNKPVAYLFRS